MTIELKNEYKWNIGASSSMTNVDVSGVVKELYAIQEKDGELNPEQIVEFAKDKSTFLHKCFNWNNKDAAHKFRINQATELLRRIEVRVLKDGEPQSLRAFEVVNRPLFKPQNYISLDLADSFVRSGQIANNDLSRALSRLEPYHEYEKVSIYIRSALEELSKVATETKEEQPALAS